MTEKAKPDHLFVCLACGRTSPWSEGVTTNGTITSPGWDATCVLNSKQVPIDRILWNADKTRIAGLRDCLIPTKPQELPADSEAAIAAADDLRALRKLAESADPDWLLAYVGAGLPEFCFAATPTAVVKLFEKIDKLTWAYDKLLADLADQTFIASGLRADNDDLTQRLITVQKEARAALADMIAALREPGPRTKRMIHDRVESMRELLGDP